MKWFIGNYTYQKFNKTVKEYYISDKQGNIVAGDFHSYNQAKRYIKTNLLHSR